MSNNMKEFKLVTDQMSVEWTVYRCDTFSVTVKSWKSKNYDFESGLSYNEFKHHWNVYANVFDTHELYKTPELAKNLPMHGGCTFDQHQTHQPIGGIKYDWQKVTNTIKVGSDYMHLYDHFEECGPKDGIPYTILEDAEELVNALLNWESFGEEQ